MTTLLQLDQHPLIAPRIWDTVTEYGAAHPDVLTVVVNVADGPGNGRDPSYTAATARLRAAGVRMLGYVDLTFATRPAAVAIGAARRAGLCDAVLNPGVPPDRIYRDLGAAVCVFDDTWERYLDWDGAGAEPGDGHLVHAVPPGEFDHAWLLQAARCAGFGMVTDLAPSQAYAGLPAWLATASPLPV